MVNRESLKLLNDLGLKFKDLKLLEQAFIHRSYLNEVRINIKSNERLEFLGDSVLSLLISQYLYSIREEDSEGELTNLRAYIVKTKSLTEAAKNLNLGSYLKLSKGEDASGGRENPQLLANTYEAFIGAVFIDQGLEAAKRVIDQTLIPFFAAAIQKGPPKDAKSLLQELVQEKIKQSPHYRILESFGPDHAKQFRVGVFVKGDNIGEGGGNSKQEAEEKAAQQALKHLNEL